jgi:hypothetical protein
MNVEGYSVTSSKTWKKKDEEVREVEWKRNGWWWWRRRRRRRSRRRRNAAHVVAA